MVAVVGIQVNHAVTLPVNPGGGSCVDPTNGFTGDQISPSGGLTLRTGLVSLIQTNDPDKTTGAIVSTNSADAAFQKFSGLYPSTNSVSPGGCIIYDYSSRPLPTLAGLDAGTITLSGPATQSVTLASQFGIKGAFYAALPASAIPQTGGDFTFKGSGGADVGAFTTVVHLANPTFTWTNRGVAASVSKTQSLTITWTGGNPGTFVYISGTATLPQRGAPPIIAGFSCEERVEAGSFTIPAYILSALPDANGGMNVQNNFFQQFTASGLDVTAAGATIAYSATGAFHSSLAK
jgi:hypothetical protein